MKTGPRLQNTRYILKKSYNKHKKLWKLVPVYKIPGTYSKNPTINMKSYENWSPSTKYPEHIQKILQ